MLLCAGLAGWLLWLPPASPVESFPLTPSGVEELQHSAGLERLRGILETYRWAQGGYPRTLEELGAPAVSALAGIRLDGYSYIRSGEGYTLQRTQHTQPRRSP